MSVRTSMVAAAMAMTLAGCASMPGEPNLSPRLPVFGSTRLVPLLDFDKCGPGICKLAVRVVDTTTPCHLSVDPKVMLFEGKNQPKTIRWELFTQGYAFPSGAVTIANPPAGEFESCGPQGSDKYACRNNHRTTGTWKYAIRVTGMCRGVPVQEYDPFFVND